MNPEADLETRVSDLEAENARLSEYVDILRDAYEKMTASIEAMQTRLVDGIERIPKAVIAEYEAEQSRAQLDKAFEGAPPGMKEAAEEWARDLAMANRTNTENLAARVSGLERRESDRDESETLYRAAVDERFVTPEKLAEAIRTVFFTRETKP